MGVCYIVLSSYLETVVTLLASKVAPDSVTHDRACRNSLIYLKIA